MRAKMKSILDSIYIPILWDVRSASWANWREAFKEVFITLFFSLMPLWLGLISVFILTISDGASNFVAKFASSAELAIVATSLLGPMLYMMFREDGSSPGNWDVPRFPSGLWFIVIVIGCCVLATTMYSYTYLSEASAFYDKAGAPIHFIGADTVALLSWVLLGIVVFLILFACTIRNSLESGTPRTMSGETEDFVADVQAGQPVADEGAQNLVAEMQATQGDP